MTLIISILRWRRASPAASGAGIVLGILLAVVPQVESATATVETENRDYASHV
jgi:hypothetical protein